MFTFGTQYLRGITPHKDQWEQDMENMKKYGFNTIRAWMVWSHIEKAEGEIDYEYISAFLNCAQKYDLNVGLLFHLHACPAWAVKKYAKYFYISDEHLPFEPTVRPNTPGGGWPGLCYDHPEVRDMEERLIRGVIEETKKYKNVAFYEPMNEPHQWIDFTKTPSGIYCYCPESIKKFQVWLQKKYQNIHALNDAWGYGYSSFDEVRPPRWTASYSDSADFRLFNMDNVAEEIKFRSDIIKSCDTKPVIAHAWGGGAATCAQLGGMAFDDWKNAQIFDKWGYSAFPQSAGDCSMLGLGCDATRCAANGKEYWQSELTAGLNGTGLNQRGRIDDNTFDKFSLESIRHGARGLLYWQYRKERYGSEFGGFSLTDNAGGETNLTRRASALCKMLNDNEDIFNNAQNDEAQVALVFSIRSYLADWNSTNRKGNKFSVDSIGGYYRMLWEENIITDIIHEEFAGNLSKYKLIILPSPFAISPKLAGQLKEYIRRGGMILSDPYFGAFDESFRHSYHIPGYGFEEIFGCKEFDFTTRECVTLSDNEKSYQIAGNRHAEYYSDVTSQVLYYYEDGSPAILCNNYGNGCAVLSGVNLGLSYSKRTLISDDIISNDSTNSSIDAKNIVMKLCTQAGIRPNICSAEGVKVSYLKTDAEQYSADALILINSSKKAAKGSIHLDRSYIECMLILGNPIAQLKDSVLEFTLNADESAVIRLQRYT